MSNPHKHAELIKLWAEGAEIQVYMADSGEWADLNTTCGWHEALKYRIKPEPPKYPQTKMTDGQLKRAFHAANGETQKGWRGIANAAIARAIEDGDIVPAAILEKLAEAVRDELVAHVGRYSTGCATYINGETDIATIIKRVKDGQ